MFIKPKEVIEFLSSRLFLMPNWNIADFGCGGGYFTTFLAEKTGLEGKVFAIDYQEDALMETKELSELLGFKNIEFHKSNLKKTAFENDFFDLVFMSQVLFQNKDFEKIILEVKRILKNNGYLIILEPKNKLNFIYGDIAEKNKVILEAGGCGLELILDKEFGENYYIVVFQK